MDIKPILAASVAFVLSSNIHASSIVINEFLPNAVGSDSGNEWIELFNTSASTVDISGWKLQKATSSYSTIFTLPSGTSLLAGEFFVLGGSNIINANANVSSIGLGNAGSSGDALRLIDGFSNIVDTVIYGANNNDGFLDDFGNISTSYATTPSAGYSLGRVFDGLDSNLSAVDFIVFDNTSMGVSNNLSSVPVPAAIWLFSAGLLGLTSIARRR